jgi:maltose alpha-D-glucosyltransferase/alpha-amylase
MGRRRSRSSADDPRWYQDAIIYQLHVKTFFDANGDGIGDVEGLIQKLDYVRRLGATCVWLLPFFESPLLDDGYDVAHYERVHAAYGSLADVRRFVASAHAMGLRVIAELVVNHTSDRHPWFQASRRAPAGSPKRDFYVWSADNRKYADARVIFSDSEPSNWTWDEMAGAYYWHRFFHHQPDLNFDSPLVRRAVLKVMRFWFDVGVDGLRLDAVAHLFERDGTTCDNLPETHAFLRGLRADLDAHYPGRVLLAEVNQTPEVTRTYFGDGDECHMVFHFPLMPRVFQALAIARAAPILDVLEQTVPLPAQCQWAVFLRNHDELTLSALSAGDREALLDLYAPSPFMRLHQGVRRRLAPLLGNDRRRIELAHALLLSLPGSPVFYYGDEIGMGDNLALPDRDGVRTPMQWSAAPHAGFTRPDVEVGVAPLIDDATYGFRTVNVEAQEGDAGSLLSCLRHLIRVRRSDSVFGRGHTDLLRCANLSVLAFVRRDEHHQVLVLANVSSEPQSVDVPLPSMAGHAVYDLINGRPVVVSPDSGPWALAPYGYCWWRVGRLAELGLLDADRTAATLP